MSGGTRSGSLPGVEAFEQHRRRLVARILRRQPAGERPLQERPLQASGLLKSRTGGLLQAVEQRQLFLDPADESRLFIGWRYWYRQELDFGQADRRQIDALLTVPFEPSAERVGVPR